ncbi:peptide/nickel transport system substrate-binding protein [Maritalea mobilis]|uniref:Peptide/nickel transport system substrate-binding protein n=1 Tax=Maritalea mobilis TaxID=483324 RepID=A0A4R6W032_9HYPH|nr:ABC transporter substrate-binding protein [Maritalea mobilis]TDQ66265.1 peptide/nickel transport system substrate-binding protein [Maritalea mobilis]
MLRRVFAAIMLTVMFSGPTAAQNSLRVAYDADPVSLDPYEQLSGGTLQLSHLIFDPLVRWTQDHEIEARLAERWEYVAPQTMRFHLRENVQFHSGNLLTAYDVEWTFNRLKTSGDFKAIFEPFTSVSVIDDHTFDVKMSQPYPLVLNSLTYLFPMDRAFYSGLTDDGRDKAEIVKHGNSFSSRNASGTGPFIVAEREQGVKSVFKRFDRYWDQQSKGNVEEIVLTPIKEDSTRLAALLSGAVDFIAPVAPSNLKNVSDHPQTKLITMPGTRAITFQLNMDRVPAFKDIRVRQAVDYAINNAGIVERIMHGFATVSAQMSPEGYVGHIEVLAPRYDLDKAKALMAEAGYADGFQVSMLAPHNRYVNDERIAQAVALMLSKINIEVDLQTIPKAQYWTQYDARAADIMMIGWHSDTEDSANFHQFLTACPNEETGQGRYNSSGYCNPDADELMQRANSEMDATLRAELLRDLEQILFDDAAFIPLHWQNLAWGVRNGILAEDIVNAQNAPYFGDLVMEAQ